MVNSHPLNGAALATWVKAAAVTASVALTATASANQVFGGRAALSGAATASVKVIRVFPGASTATGRAQSSVYPWYQGAGEALLVGRATALAACERTVYAEAYGTATATGSAIPESEIGEVTGEASLTITAEATRNRPGRGVFTTGATATPPAVVFGQTVNLTAGGSARAEASIRLSGEGFWRHDGYVEAAATGALSPQVTWSIQSVPLGMGFSIAATATRQRPATALMAVTAEGLVAEETTKLGAAVATANALGTVTGTWVRAAAATATTASSSRLAVPPLQDHAGTVNGQTALTVSAAPLLRWQGVVAATTRVAGAVTGTRTTFATVAASGTLAVDLTPARSNPALVYLYGSSVATVDSTAAKVGAVNATAGLVASDVVQATQHYAASEGQAGVQATATEFCVRGGAVDATAQAEVSSTLATSHKGVVNATAEAAVSSTLATSHKGVVNATAEAAVSSTLATSHKGVVNATAGLTTSDVVPATQHYATSVGRFVAQAEAAGVRERLATVLATVSAQGTVRGSVDRPGAVSPPSATATGRAFGLRRGDLNAPPERSMILGYEPRGMIVPPAERTLWVPA